MKKYIYFAFAGIVALCASCNKELNNNIDVPSANGNASLVVDIQGLPMATKAATKAGETEYQTNDEKKVSQVDIAIYDASGVLEWSKHYNEARTSRQTITGLTVGQKTIGVIANLTVETIPTTLANFKALASDLKDNGRSNLVMTGIAEGMASTNPEPATLKLARIAAKFSVDGNITTEWEGDAPQAFDITDIYLANVATASNVIYAPASPSLNLRSSVEVTSDVTYKDLTVASKQSWSSGSPFNGGVSFYGYPNNDSARTAIMIKALYENKVCYYPLVINQEIKNNTLYKIGNIKITCEGVENPWDDFTKVKILFDIEVVDWDYNEIYPEFTF